VVPGKNTKNVAGNHNMKKMDFKPKLGQTDYTNIRRAPVINCVVKYNDKILIVQRNPSMKFYPGYWNGISGFIDDTRSVKEKAKDELKEEIGLEEKDIINITEGEVFEQEEPKYDKIWIVHPVLVEVKTDKIKLDWEAQDFRWIDPKEVDNYKLVPGFDKVLRTLLKS
jgi:isopentenyldiphosphate isomerase